MLEASTKRTAAVEQPGPGMQAGLIVLLAASTPSRGPLRSFQAGDRLCSLSRRPDMTAKCAKVWPSARRLASGSCAASWPDGLKEVQEQDAEDSAFDSRNHERGQHASWGRALIPNMDAVVHGALKPGARSCSRSIR